MNDVLFICIILYYYLAATVAYSYRFSFHIILLYRLIKALYGDVNGYLHYALYVFGHAPDNNNTAYVFSLVAQNNT